MNFIKSTVIYKLESLRDYLEQQDESLQARPKMCVEYFAPESIESDKIKGDNISTGSSDEKEASSDEAAIDKKKAANFLESQQLKMDMQLVACDLVDISVFYACNTAKRVQQHDMYKLTNKSLHFEEKISFVYDRSLQGYEWASEIYQRL
tara:strand:+ start:144 stop:593 length:450 start_codon:yes stop_codon:yes gene_type:complete